ncbi:hypothetical protein EVAR_72646_1 [Eumeta japonica]|uniref:Uncharacterized protein n=1 Tax=Eumeta variegata TaxID=151549 RepID=A0A4C1T469_EUMVA|nr:hypothetical protein EVAR_72646_1 [Eumeta japonica]
MVSQAAIKHLTEMYSTTFCPGMPVQFEKDGGRANVGKKYIDMSPAASAGQLCALCLSIPILLSDPSGNNQAE